MVTYPSSTITEHCQLIDLIGSNNDVHQPFLAISLHQSNSVFWPKNTQESQLQLPSPATCRRRFFLVRSKSRCFKAVCESSGPRLSFRSISRSAFTWHNGKMAPEKYGEKSGVHWGPILVGDTNCKLRVFRHFGYPTFTQTQMEIGSNMIQLVLGEIGVVCL